MYLRSQEIGATSALWPEGCGEIRFLFEGDTYVPRNCFVAGSGYGMRVKSVRVVTVIRNGIYDDVETLGSQRIHVRTVRRLLLSKFSQD